VVSTLQFTWRVTVFYSLSGSLGRLNSLSSFGCSSAIPGFTENSGHSAWIPTPDPLLVHEARKLTTAPDPQIQESSAHKENVMLNAAHEIHQAQNVHELLLSTVKQVRALHATLSALMTDVAAIRRTFLHDRGEMVHYKKNLRSAIETAKPIVDEAMQSYDEMIRQIQESEGWRN